MRYGVALFTSDRGLAPAPAASAVEERGFDAFFVPEHTHIPIKRTAPHPSTGDAWLPDERYKRPLDPWVSLGAASAVTSRIALGTAVSLPVEHDPITLAKSVATLDHLTGGRVVLGVGFGWNTDELEDHGVDPSRRRGLLRQYLEAMQSLWSEEEASYEGADLRFGPSWAYPKTVQQPRPPVLVGASGTERTLDWIVRSADGWITTPRDREIDDQVRTLQRKWRDAGRPGEPRIVALDGKPDPARLAGWEELGVTDVLYGTPDRSADEVLAYLDRLAAKLSIASARR